MSFAASIEARLNEMGIVLPTPAVPVANYVPFVRTGNQLFISGQLPMGPDGLAYTGKLGAELGIEEGQAAARLCAINLLAQVKAATGGDWNKLVRLVKLVGFVNSTPDFTSQAPVMNGASDLMVDILGDAGRHARSAVSAGSLPLGAGVEIEAIFELA